MGDDERAEPRAVNDLRWRARIDTNEGRTLGAGVLVAEWHVLTCAHVVAGRSSVQVAFPDGAWSVPATVVWRGEWRKAGDAGDIAVLELAAEAPVKPCELATPDALRSRADGECRLRAHGFPRGHEKDGTHVTLHADPDRMLRGEWLEIDVERAHLQRLDKGFSGAAGYLPESGEVVGMVTDAVLDAGRGGFQGRMLPLDTIRRHWEALDDLLPLDWLDAEPRRRLRALVDGAAVTGDLRLVFRRAFPAFLRTPPEFASVWDAVRYVGEIVPGADRLRRFLATLAPHLTGDVRSGLTGWLRQWLPAPDEAGHDRAPATSIIVRLDELTRGASLELTVCTVVDGVPAHRTGPVRVRRDQVRRRVESLLPAHLPDVHDHDWMIEFVLPESLLNEPFEDWHIREPGRRPQPMRSVPLVVRHVDRLKPLMVAQLTRRRWETARAGGATRFEPVDPRLGYGYEEFRDWLDAEEDLCVLVYAATPERDWLSAALDVGIPIMLWRRQACAGCGSGDFVGHLLDALAGVAPDRLPVEVMKLRKKARSPVTGGDRHCGRRLTLFWDDPARSPDPPLAMGRA